jgi:drug/metabolite transporter (DMT)-like permease
VVSIQPVFAVLMAWLLFGDIPSLRTVLGGLVILGAVIWVTRE